MWRVGHVSDPLSPPPRELCSWDGRFDDPRREFRTVYAARKMETALREVLAPLRPSAKVVAELTGLFGAESPAVKALGTVKLSDLASKSMALGVLSADGDLVDVSDIAVRSGLERRYAHVLAAHDAEHLDVTDISSRQRALTQGLARALYDDSAAGVRYSSNIDGLACVGLFEGRARLDLTGGPPTPLPDARLFVQSVCGDLGLNLVD